MLALMLEEKLKIGDKILVVGDAHHSNLLPWQKIAQRKNENLEILPVTPKGEIDLNQLEEKLRSGTIKILVCSHVSNVLGTIFPVEKMATLAHKYGALISVDGAQGVGHTQVNVKKLDVDFYAFSGHKIFAPSGVGVLYGKFEHLKNLAPLFVGGGMPKTVTYENFVSEDAPHKFEAGTPPIAQAVGLGAALEYVEHVGLENILEHEKKLQQTLHHELANIPTLKLIGESQNKISLQSFVLSDKSVYDVVTLLAEQEICVRSGHHCAQPLLNSLGYEACLRASCALYNNEEDIQKLCDALRKVLKILK